MTASRRRIGGLPGTGFSGTGSWAPNLAATSPAAGATGRPSGSRWSGWPTTTTAAVTTATAHSSARAACQPATWAARSVTAASW
jgi:hypothetical protein